MTKQSTAWLLACTAGLSLTATGQALFQNAPQKSPPQRPGFRTDVSLVLVDVHVTTAERPVTDLTAADFNVQENGTAQRIATFEFVPVESAPSTVAVEPNSVAASLDLAADPRNRVFVLFLDAFHVTESNSLYTPAALVNTIERFLAPTDLLGVMTPHMAPSELTLARRRDVVRRGLLDNPRWGRKVESCRSIFVLDDVEKMYTVCYPPHDARCDISPLAMELIRVRRESFTLGVLRDLVRYIGATRAARTAVILATEGWALDKPNQSLANQGAATPPRVGIGPGGRLGTQGRWDVGVDKGVCDQHLASAAQQDNQRAFRDLIDDANRNNASFHILDPGGLRFVGGHVDTLRTLADNTNGDAIVDTNDLAGGLRRAVRSLSGYYLLGYYSTDSRPNGTYRSIRVNVSRSGVEVRARKGYRAWTAQELKAMAGASATPVAAPADAPAAADRATALGRLAKSNPGAVFLLHGSIDPAGTALHVAGELSSAVSRGPEWRGGAEAQLLVTGPDGASAGSARVTVPAGGRSFQARIPLETTAMPGDYEVITRLRPAGGSTPLIESVHIQRPAGGMGEPLAFRSADRTQPVATFTWSRVETAHVEAPVTVDAGSPAARLLDRAGSPVPVPLDVSVREDGDGRWIVALLKLAPLAPGDYLIELSVITGAQTVRRFTPVRVLR